MVSLPSEFFTQMVKNPPATQETWVEKIPWRTEWQPTPIFLPGESPWTEEPDRLQFIAWKKSNMIQQLNHHHQVLLVPWTVQAVGQAVLSQRVWR